MSVKCFSRSIVGGGLSHNRKEPASLYNTTREALIWFRVIGFLPLTGLTNRSSDKLRCTLWSPYIIYYAFSMFGQILMFLGTIIQIYRKGIQLGIFTNFIFNASNLAVALILTKTSYSWPTVMKTFEEIENQLPYFRRNFRATVTLATAFMIAISAGDHVLYVSHGFIIAYACNSDNIIDTYLKLYKPTIFEYTQGTPWKWVISEIFSLQGSFNFNYNEILMVLTSLYLTEYFLIHNKRLKKAVQEDFFLCENFRLEYLKIVHLVKLINDWFGICLFISITTNLFSACVHLFYVISASNTFLDPHYTCSQDQKDFTFLLAVNHYTYFVYSLSYLLLRTALVLVISARVYTNGSAPVYILYDLPTSRFSTEVQKYIAQVKAIKIAISGLDFFHVTRGMILTIFTTIVTYEVMLLQFYKLNNWI